MPRDHETTPGNGDVRCPVGSAKSSGDLPDAQPKDAASEVEYTGHIPFFLRKRIGYLTRGHFRYGDVIPIGWRSRSRLLTDPADIHHILVASAENYVKTIRLSSEDGKRRAGHGLLTSSGAEHRQRRRLLQPLFHQRSVDPYCDLVVNETNRMMLQWDHGGQIDMADEMAKLSCGILIAIVFGADWTGNRQQLVDAIAARRRHTEYLYHSRLPFHDLWPTRTVRENRQAIDAIDQVVYREIQLRRKKPAGDFLSQLVLAKSSDGLRLSDQDVRDEVLTLTSAGHETTADALAWTWYLIASHQEVEAQWRNELQQVVADQPLSPELVKRLTYTRMILEESNRLYPPTWLYARVPLAKDTLPSGLQVGPGDTLLLCQYLMHRHPGFYPDPERFDPERFRDAPVGSKLRQAYFPFGAGPHTCIGEVLSRMQSILVLATVGTRFRIQLVPDQRITPEPGVTLYPRNGIQVRPGSLLCHANTLTEAAPASLRDQ